MATFGKFEEIVAWQKAREVNRRIYQLTIKNNFAKDFDLRSQIRRASVSIMANIAEGFGRHSDREFANFINIAHGSASEVQSHLYVALDLGYIEETDRAIYDQLSEVCRMLYALGKRLRLPQS